MSMSYSRRQFGKVALTTLPLAAAALSNLKLVFAAEKPDSKFDGVEIGVIIPYSYHNMPNDAESLLTFMVRDGLSGAEIQSPPVEEFAGAPKDPNENGPATRRPGNSPEAIAVRKSYAEEMTKWRLSAPMAKFVELRRMYNKAGVTLYGFKLQLTMDMPDAEYDYAFKAAKTLGANQLTMELPKDPNESKRIGEFAGKHKFMVGYHAHLQANPTAWDVAMSQSPYNGINMDIGHYVAAGNHDALDFIRKNHARITSIHLKDRKYKENVGQNMPWGQGDTPIKEVLQLMKTERYKFPGAIELEYAPPEGSDSEKEIVKCLAYAKAALV
jgi:sugar phosphate isomerase/epimerase